MNAYDPKKDYAKASFRGVPFEFETAATEVGREIVVWEFPGNDVHDTVDTGLKPDRLRIQAYVAGPDFKSTGHQLLEAFRTEGPGKLAHPIHGEMDVLGIKCRLLVDAAGLGWLGFSLEFIPPGEANFPAPEKDYSYQAAKDGKSLRNTAGQVFQQLYKTVGPAWLAVAAQGDITAAFDMVRTAVRTMPGPLDAAAAAAYLEKLDAAASKIEETIGDPQAIAADVIGDAMGGLGGLAGDPGSPAAVDAALEVASKFGAAPGGDNASRMGGWLPPVSLPAITFTRKQLADNRRAVVSAVRGHAIAEAVDAALAMDFTAYQDAQAVQDKIMDALAEQILDAGDAGDDETMHALTALRESAQEAFRQKAAALPRLVEMEPSPAVRPLLVDAYDIYQDGLGGLDDLEAREAEIVRRNAIAQPGLPPHAPLLVLDA